MDAPDEKDIDGNPFLFSNTIALGNKSFLNSISKYVHLAPPPKYFTEELLMKGFGKLPTEKDEIL